MLLFHHIQSVTIDEIIICNICKLLCRLTTGKPSLCHTDTDRFHDNIITTCKYNNTNIINNQTVLKEYIQFKTERTGCSRVGPVGHSVVTKRS